MCFGDNVDIDLSDPSRHHVQFHDCHQGSATGSANGDAIEASGDCEVQAIRSDYTVLKAKIQPMIANNVYTLRFSYDVNDEHLEQDVTVRVK